MKNRILLSLLTLTIAVNFWACTSSDSKDSGSSDVISDSSENADAEESTVPESEQATSSETANEDSLAATDLNADSKKETTQETTTTTTTEESTDLNNAAVDNTTTATKSETLPAEPMAEGSSTGTETAAAPPPEYTPTPVPESQTTMVESKTTTSTETVHSTSTAKPLQKMETTPRQVGGVYYNTVYFARPGDNWGKISQKIYGDKSKVAELKSGNPGVKSPHPGDKIYYNSPKRADDSTRVITYYEDNGIAPQVYTTQDGDNVKKFSKKLLGYKDAWKEIWASNAVESKDSVAAGTQIQYWPDQASVAAAPPAEGAHHDNAIPPAHPVQANAQAAAGEMPDMGGELPPPPADNGAAGAVAKNANELPPPPPPPPAEMAPPPPPPPPPVAQHEQPAAPPAAEGQQPAATGEMDQDTTMAIGVGAIALIGLVALIMVRRKRKQRESEGMMPDSQVGT